MQSEYQPFIQTECVVFQIQKLEGILNSRKNHILTLNFFGYRCLKGPNEKDPIPQLFYTKPRTLQPTNDEVTFKVYGREDYKQDGPQAVDVSFTVNTGSASFQLPSTKVNNTLN